MFETVLIGRPGRWPRVCREVLCCRLERPSGLPAGVEALTGMISPGLLAVPRRLSRASAFPEGGALVREEDAKVFVVDAHQLLAVKGCNPVITPANERRLVHLGVLMLDAFGITGPATEDSDG